jgi:hypothetical protein
MESPAWQVLNLPERRCLDRVRIELGHQGGNEATRLCVTYNDFQKYGVRRHSIAPSIRALVALGFLEVTQQGRAGNAEFRRPTYFRLTFINSNDDERTHEWKYIKSMREARAIVRKARQPMPTKRPAKQKASVQNGTRSW